MALCNGPHIDQASSLTHVCILAGHFSVSIDILGPTKWKRTQYIYYALTQWTRYCKVPPRWGLQTGCALYWILSPLTTPPPPFVSFLSILESGLKASKAKRGTYPLRPHFEDLAALRRRTLAGTAAWVLQATSPLWCQPHNWNLQVIAQNGVMAKLLKLLRYRTLEETSWRAVCVRVSAWVVHKCEIFLLT